MEKFSLQIFWDNETIFKHNINSRWLHSSRPSAFVSSKIFYFTSLLHATHQFPNFFCTQWLFLAMSYKPFLEHKEQLVRMSRFVPRLSIYSHPASPWISQTSKCDFTYLCPTLPLLNLVIPIQNASTNITPNIFQPPTIIFNWTLPSKLFYSCVFSICIYICWCMSSPYIIINQNIWG